MWARTGWRGWTSRPTRAPTSRGQSPSPSPGERRSLNLPRDQNPSQTRNPGRVQEIRTRKCSYWTKNLRSRCRPKPQKRAWSSRSNCSRSWRRSITTSSRPRPSHRRRRTLSRSRPLPSPECKWKAKRSSKAKLSGNPSTLRSPLPRSRRMRSQYKTRHHPLKPPSREGTLKKSGSTLKTPETHPRHPLSRRYCPPGNSAFTSPWTTSHFWKSKHQKKLWSSRLAPRTQSWALKMSTPSRSCRSCIWTTSTQTWALRPRVLDSVSPGKGRAARSRQDSSLYLGSQISTEISRMTKASSSSKTEACPAGLAARESWHNWMSWPTLES